MEALPDATAETVLAWALDPQGRPCPGSLTEATAQPAAEHLLRLPRLDEAQRGAFQALVRALYPLAACSVALQAAYSPHGDVVDMAFAAVPEPEAFVLLKSACQQEGAALIPHLLRRLPREDVVLAWEHLSGDGKAAPLRCLSHYWQPTPVEARTWLSSPRSARWDQAWASLLQDDPQPSWLVAVCQDGDLAASLPQTHATWRQKTLARRPASVPRARWRS